MKGFNMGEIKWTRMSHWLVIAFGLIVMAGALEAVIAHNKFSVVMWKVGLVTVAAHVGYWIEREANKRTLSSIDDKTKALCRAIIIAASIAGVCWGM